MLFLMSNVFISVFSIFQVLVPGPELETYDFIFNSLSNVAIGFKLTEFQNVQSTGSQATSMTFAAVMMR